MLQQGEHIMMTSSNGNIFRITVPLWGEFTGHRWIPLIKASNAELDVFLNLRLNKLVSKQSRRWQFETPSRSLWRHCNYLSTYLEYGPVWYGLTVALEPWPTCAPMKMKSRGVPCRTIATITVTSWWARWRLKSPAPLLFAQPFVQAGKRKHQSSASLAFVRGIHRSPADSHHKGPVTRKMFPFDDVIMSMRGTHRSGGFIHAIDPNMD